MLYTSDTPLFTCSWCYITYFTSRAKAIAPDTIGVAALVPPKFNLQLSPGSVVICRGLMVLAFIILIKPCSQLQISLVYQSHKPPPSLMSMAHQRS